MTVAVEDLTGQGLVREELFDRLVNRIAKEHGKPRELAARIMDQALAFLAACAHATEPLSPSETVDIGWHTFILYTREYAAFCDRIAGRFMHHEPSDTGAIPVTRSPADSMTATVEALRSAGFAVDLPLWVASTKCRTNDCHQCSQGCTSSNGDTGCHHHPERIDTVPA
ncbi:hypothetical protein G3I59_36875 [Amycolatopsis rubida]|uniref:Uncharacterized protein n=1 Tax=Amycolatopsis rubida TaxID=112413 RepID=A0ABX0C2J9_9PSEU|nr:MULTISPECIES: hypothetical protein [Amycolatopsis]MYW96034.1 hypothetical protein [Amycolatopsis rubida]NEC61025.1 hypothetical protein [Amycolatopsis rubida]OAP20535.1 hypothetical protein A4R44_08695 [Amycolatopsis sp. M39]